VSTPAVDESIQELEDRFGPLYDLAVLARYCQVRRSQLRRALESAGVPIIEVGRKQLVPQELAEKALGLDFAEVLLEIHRNEQWMRRQELDARGRRKTTREYAKEMGNLAREALQSIPSADKR
jgi:hypothetical protein